MADILWEMDFEVWCKAKDLLEAGSFEEPGTDEFNRLLDEFRSLPGCPKVREGDHIHIQLRKPTGVRAH